MYGLVLLTLLISRFSREFQFKQFQEFIILCAYFTLHTGNRYIWKAITRRNYSRILKKALKSVRIFIKRLHHRVVRRINEGLELPFPHVASLPTYSRKVS